MRSLIQNKKGEISDTLIFVITIFILGIGFFIIAFIVPSLTNGLRTAGLNNSIEGINALNSMDLLGTSTINNGFLFLSIGLIASVMITSFLVRTHPIFLFMYIFFLAISILLSFYLGNIYQDMVANPIFASFVSSQTYINVFLNNIAEITLGVGAISIIIVFSKFSTFGGTQQF